MWFRIQGPTRVAKACCIMCREAHNVVGEHACSGSLCACLGSAQSPGLVQRVQASQRSACQQSAGSEAEMQWAVCSNCETNSALLCTGSTQSTGQTSLQNLALKLCMLCLACTASLSPSYTAYNYSHALFAQSSRQLMADFVCAVSSSMPFMPASILACCFHAGRGGFCGHSSTTC